MLCGSVLQSAVRYDYLKTYISLIKNETPNVKKTCVFLVVRFQMCVLTL